MTKEEKRDWLLKTLKVKAYGDHQLEDEVPQYGGKDYLPKPIADELIREIVEQNYCRKVFRSIPMSKRTLTIPIMDYGLANVKQVGLGVGAPTGSSSEQSYRSITLDTGKLAAYAELEIDDIEDSAFDVVDNLMENFAIAFGKAEEYAMLRGAKNRASADADKIFDGIYTIAADALKCNRTPVVYNPAVDFGLSDGIADAIKELGLFGKNKQLVLFAGDGFVNKLRKDRAFRGDMGGTIIKDGRLPTVWGVMIYETTYVPSEEAVLIPKDEAVIGQGKNFKVVREDDVIGDKVEFAAFERIDFRLRHVDAAGLADAVVLLKV